MNNNDLKMPIILIGNSFKYEIEATVKLFIHASRFNFFYEITDVSDYDEYIIAETAGNKIKAEIKLKNKDKICLEKDLGISNQAELQEHELCRLIFNGLKQLTGISPSWGLLTGIRPVKKVTALIQQGMSKPQITDILTKKYEISPLKLELAFQTAYNQLPILNKIELNEIMDALKEVDDSDRISVKALERQQRKIEERLEKLLSSKKDSSLCFEKLGFDYLVCDEAHNYKNCFVTTKMSNVAGVQTTAAQKSEDMLMKTQYLNDKYGCNNILFAIQPPKTYSLPVLSTAVTISSLQRELPSAIQW